ncbi:MAG: carbonic anhydrase [Gemmatimonadaceae bacterium]
MPFPKCVVCAVAILIVVPAGLRAQWKTPWEYAGVRGPAHWGALDSAYATCKTGQAQSPIDIAATTTEALPALKFAYHRAPLRYLIDNGHTIRVNYHDPGSGDFLVVGGRRYQLTQLHFHHPSEELVDGKAYPMEVHLMHVSGDGQVIGVTVFLRVGRANPAVQRMLGHMPPDVGREEDVPGVSVDPRELLPHNLGYYTYEGSVTAPPCTEHVTWFVLKTPVDVSAAQVAVFAKRYPHNARPVMPLNGRIIRSSR